MARGLNPPLGTTTSRLVSTHPGRNPFTPPIPAPTTDVNNLAACVVALKAGVESLNGQRGDAANRAVTFRDMINYGILDPSAVQSPGGSLAASGTVTSITAGTGLTGGTIATSGTIALDIPVSVAHGGTGATTVAGSPFLPLTGGVLAAPGNLTVNGTTSLAAATATTPPTADNSIKVATTAFVKAQGYTSNLGTVTSITAGTGLTGGTITGAGTIALSVPVSVANGGTGATTVAGSPYLPLTGGTLTGALTAPTFVGALTGHASLDLALTGGTLTGNLGSPGYATRSGISGAYTGHTFVIDWTGAAANLWIDTINIGTIATTAQLGNYLPLTGGTVTGNLTVSGNIILSNTAALYGRDTGGTAHTLIWIDASNQLNICDQLRPIIMGGPTYPTQSNVWQCGTASNYWYQVFTGGGGYQTGSDRRMKTDIEDLPDCLDLVREIAPQRFRWKDGPDTTRTHWGFIAQDVGEVMGEDFAGYTPADPAEPKSIAALNYNQLVAVLWKACQELLTRVEQLEAA